MHASSVHVNVPNAPLMFKVFKKTHVPSRSFADRSECPSDVQSFQKTHVPPSSFADSVSNPQYFSTSVPSPGGAPSPPAYRSDFSPTISSATSDDPSTASFPTLNSSFSKIHFAVLSNDSFASTISSGPSTSVDSSHGGSTTFSNVSTNNISGPFVDDFSTSFFESMAAVYRLRDMPPGGTLPQPPTTATTGGTTPPPPPAAPLPPLTAGGFSKAQIFAMMDTVRTQAHDHRAQ